MTGSFTVSILVDIFGFAIDDDAVMVFFTLAGEDTLKMPLEDFITEFCKEVKLTDAN